MMRTTIRRAGLLVATTALAGTAFAGTAFAGEADDVTGVGGAGGYNTTQCVVPINALADVPIIGLLGNTANPKSVKSCNGSADGGSGSASGG